MDPFGVGPRFGSFRGLVRLALAHVDTLSGRTRALGRVRWADVERIVFVCRGNICRSAYAQRLAEVRGLPTASFGLKTSTGKPAIPDAQAAAAARGVDLSAHRTCDVSDFTFCEGDLFAAMELRHVAMLRPHVASAPSHQITLLGRWSRPPRPHIHDPYGLDPRYFDRCFVVVESAVETIGTLLENARTDDRE